MQTERIQQRIENYTADLPQAVQSSNGARFAMLLSLIASNQEIYTPERLPATGDGSFQLEGTAQRYPDPNEFYTADVVDIRTGLKAHNQTFPDMKKKPCQNPTARWVFLCFSGLHELTVGEGPPLVVNLQPRQQVIIDVLGERYRRLYS